MNRSSMNRARPTTRVGFSLIEILIAILVLALGLLGLGAVFPAVISEQRDAVDSTRGAAASASAAATLRGAEQWVGGYDGREPQGANRPRLASWDMLSGDKYFGRRQNERMGVGNGSSLPTSRWEATWNWLGEADNSTGPNTLGRFYTPYRNLGVIAFNGWDHNDDVWIKQERESTTPDDAIIPVASRLIPPPFSGEDPKYVWDMVLRLEPGSRRTQAVIFVRRVDQRIRTSEQFSLSRVLTDGTIQVSGGAVSNGTRATAFPVAVDDSGRPVAGDSPSAFYAMPLSADILEGANNGFFDEDGDGLYERIVIDGIGNAPTGYPADAVLIELAGQRGQLLVDNLGTVRTVVELDDQERIVVTPPFTEAQVRGGFFGTGGGGGAPANSVDSARAQQIVFTPQIPVSVEVTRVQE